MNKALAPIGELMMKIAQEISNFLCNIAISEAKLRGASESEIAELKKQTKEITDQGNNRHCRYHYRYSNNGCCRHWLSEISQCSR